MEPIDIALVIAAYVAIGFTGFMGGLWWAYRDERKRTQQLIDKATDFKCNAIPLVPRQEQWNGPEPAGRRPIPPPPDTPIEKLVRVYERSQEPRRPA